MNKPKDPLAHLNLPPEKRQWVNNYMQASGASAHKLAMMIHGKKATPLQGYQLLEAIIAEMTNHLVSKTRGNFNVADLTVICAGMIGAMVGANATSGAKIPPEFPEEIGKMVEGGIRLGMEGVRQKAAKGNVQVSPAQKH